MFDLEGKKALITGASGGIGKEIAKVLVEHNAEVCISGRNHEELNALKKSLGMKCHVVTCDLSKKDIDWNQFIDGDSIWYKIGA